MASSLIFSRDLTLLARTQTGSDTWGNPVVEEKKVATKGYFYQFGTEDPDRSGAVSSETVKVLMAPLIGNLVPEDWFGVEVDVEGTTRRYEIVGDPEPKYTLARGGKLHHWELLVTKAAA